MAKNNKISIYLLKPEYNKDNVIRDEYKKLEPTLYSNEKCTTFSAECYAKSPDWISSFYNNLQCNVFTTYPKVVSIYTLNIGDEKVSFALPFGGGKSMLVNDSWVEDFGLKVLLNSVETNQFRQLQTSDCGKNFINTSSQLPKFGSIDDFSFDFNTEILKKAVAKCDDELFENNNIVGGDGISVTIPYKCDNIEEFLVECYMRYQMDKYKEHFAWLDNIREVKDVKLKESLEGEIVRNINEGNFEKVWMSVPEVINWEIVNCFKFRKKDAGEQDIDIESFIKTFDNNYIDDFEQIKSKKVDAYGYDDKVVYTWAAHKCLMAELNFKGNVYCYNSGKWYIVNQDYSKEIEQYYDSIELYENGVIECDERVEKDYNNKLARSIDNSIVMDCENINALESGKAPVELCDVLTMNKELIHVKKGESSSCLSHLYNQARVSSDLLLYPEFRNRANAKIGYDYFKNDFDPREYTIVLGVITKYRSERPKIPFFSKVAIKYLMQDLQKMKYNVRIANIYNSYINGNI